jgi:dihydroorotase
MPSSKFLIQTDSDAFEELKAKTTLPYFLTDVSMDIREFPKGRKIIPLTDEEATVTYYLICRKEKKILFR